MNIDSLHILLKLLLKRFYLRTTISINKQNTPLHLAASHGQMLMVKCLLDFNCKILTNKRGFTAFVISIFNQNSKVANFFVEVV